MDDSTDKQQQEAPQATTTEEPSLLDEIVHEMKMQPTDDGYDQTRQGVEALVSELLRSREVGQRIDRKTVDQMIAEIDRRISLQVDEIVHHAEFQKMESSWKGLKFLVDRVDFRENMRVHMLQATKRELLDDFEDASEVMTSGLYRHVYTAEYGQFGGKPFGCMVANYEFGPASHDIALLRYVGSVAAMAHAPFLAAADPEFFGPGENDFQKLPYLKDLQAHFENPRYTKWQGLRQTEDTRYIGLCMPRFMLRGPYKAEEGRVKGFNYDETVVDHREYLWGNAAFALASRVADSFGRFRWCPNIIGPRAGGEVDDLPIHTYEAMGEVRTKVPTEVLLSERREFELSEEGFIGLTMRKESDNACFFSANSIQKPKYFGTSEKGRQAETNYRLGTQLPYIFIICRIAHYIKVLQREHLGSWTTREQLQGELNEWIEQYVINMDNPPGNIRSSKPLRGAKIEVEDVPGQPGWYKVDMRIMPHIKYMGAFFTLSLVGKLDKSG
jgi:type VI secretion system protein ImpC